MPDETTNTNPADQAADPGGRWAAQRKHELRRLRRRYRRDRRFRMYGIIALLIAVAFLVVFLLDIVLEGYTAFYRYEIKATLNISPETVDNRREMVEDVDAMLVSSATLLDIQLHAQEYEFHLPVRYIEGAVQSPIEAVIQGVRRQAGEKLAELDGQLAQLENRNLEGRAAEVRQQIEQLQLARDKVISAVRQFIDPSRLALALKNNLEENPDLAGTVDEVWAPTTMHANRQLHNVHNELTHEQQALLQEVVFFHLGAFYPDTMRKKYNAPLYGEGEKQETWLLAAATVDQYLKGKHSQISEERIAEVERLKAQGRIRSLFNARFFADGNSRKPEAAGIWAAVVGSVYLLLIVLACAFPVGVLTAIYLEEYAPDNRFTQIIEVNINNLAAIPSILYGLLGLALFINLMGIERGASLAGGLTLALRTLPIIIITTRAALRAVPGSIRLAAQSVGATKWQTILHHLLPLSVPGILTGTIIGLAQAIGETAPLIIIGMVAFRSSPPESINAPSTALPAQIYRWFTNAQAGFGEKAAAGIMVLLFVLLSMNAVAIFLRARFEKKW